MELITGETQLEKAIRAWFVENKPFLNEQFHAATVVKREYSGVGFFFHITVPKTIDQIPRSLYITSPIDGPMIESKELEYGGQAILFLENGYISMLEIYAFGNSFPKNLQQFQLVDIY
ncbi:MAG: hypothetical protein WCP97_09500 [bacterium]